MDQRFLYLIWLGLGFLGSVVLSRAPRKFAFSRSFNGSMTRTTLAVLRAFAPFLGPIWLVIALLLPEKKICPSCGAAARISEANCPKCSGHVPDSEPVPSQSGDVLLQSQVAQFSPEVRAAIERGQKEITGPAAVIMIGLLIVSLVLTVFVLRQSQLAAWVMGIGFVSSFVLSWLWWSYKTPRWREWALRQPGVKAEEFQRAAEVAMLVWPKGHFFEKTEIRPRKK